MAASTARPPVHAALRAEADSCRGSDWPVALDRAAESVEAPRSESSSTLGCLLGCLLWIAAAAVVEGLLSLGPGMVVVGTTFLLGLVWVVWTERSRSSPAHRRPDPDDLFRLLERLDGPPWDELRTRLEAVEPSDRTEATAEMALDHLVGGDWAERLVAHRILSADPGPHALRLLRIAHRLDGAGADGARLAASLLSTLPRPVYELDRRRPLCGSCTVRFDVVEIRLGDGRDAAALRYDGCPSCGSTSTGWPPGSRMLVAVLDRAMEEGSRATDAQVELFVLEVRNRLQPRDRRITAQVPIQLGPGVDLTENTVGLPRRSPFGRRERCLADRPAA